MKQIKKIDKFIIVTDMRERIDTKGRKIVLNTDQIISIESVEDGIVKDLGYKTIICTVKDNFYVSETLDEIIYNVW